MSSRAPWQSVAVGIALALAGSAHAAVKDAAELLPAQTLACVEVRQPERLSREIATLLKGSELEDMPAVMARLRRGWVTTTTNSGCTVFTRWRVCSSVRR